VGNAAHEEEYKSIGKIEDIFLKHNSERDFDAREKAADIHNEKEIRIVKNIVNLKEN
jgi:hypothetical protein